jgi:hypothetical protein
VKHGILRGTRPWSAGGRRGELSYHALDALKVISEKYLGDESARLRFLREARSAARLRHSNVASVLHLGRTGSTYFYAMEFVEGETLEKLIKRSSRLEVKLALEIATQAAAGLAAVHWLAARTWKRCTESVSRCEITVGKLEKEPPYVTCDTWRREVRVQSQSESCTRKLASWWVAPVRRAYPYR